jgi:hypothetical protein
MQFIKRGDCLTVVRITGPSHNILGLELRSDSTHSSITVASLKESTRPNSLSPEDVKKNVLLGVAEANHQLGTAYFVKRIEFIPDDSPPAKIYYALAKSIIERLVANEPFADG